MRAASWSLALGSMALWAAALHAAEIAPAGRLPTTIVPMAYRLDLRVDPAQERFRGHVEIDTLWQQAARRVWLHGNGLAVAAVEARAAGRAFAARYAQVDPSGVARLEFSDDVPAGPVTLVLDYSAPFAVAPEGLFHAKVGPDWYAWSQSEPIDARRFFPGFDDPGFKTPFTVSVTAPKGAQVYANAPETGVSPQGAMLTHRFAPTRPLPTYLLSIAVGPFDVREERIAPNAVRAQPLPFRVIATHGQAAHMDVVLAEAPRLLALLEEYFGTPYPYEKLDFVASPVESGAMENAGLLLFEDPIILVDKDASGRQLGDFANSCAHELAHQWLGDLVTPAWWNDLWLSESFAEWMGAKFAARWRADLGIEAVELADHFRGMDLDALGHGRPVREEIDTNAGITSAFDEITYQKGAQVLAMFEGYLGADTFASGVRLYVQRHRDGNASGDDFLAALAESAGNPAIVPALRSFIDRTGVPVVTVTYDKDGTHVAQARYQLMPSEAGAAPQAPQQWTIPICLASGGNRLCTLLSAADAQLGAVVDGAAPVMPNAGSVGYYRYRFDDAGWDRLIAAAPGLPELDAMGLADSLWADFAAGQSSIERVIAGARALAANPGSLAATALGERLGQLAQTVLEPAQRPRYRALMRSIYAPPLQRLGADPRAGAYAGDTRARRALREALLPLAALEGADPALRTRLAAAAKASLDGDAAALDESFRRVAYTVGVRDGGLAFLGRLRAALLRSTDPVQREDAAWAIGLADSAATAEAALKLALSPRLPMPEASRMLRNLASQAGARETVLAYAYGHFAELARLYPAFDRPGMVKLFEGGCSGGDAARVEAYFTPHMTELAGGALELAQSRERIARCAAFKNARSAELANAFSGS